MAKKIKSSRREICSQSLVVGAGFAGLPLFSCKPRQEPMKSSLQSASGGFTSERVFSFFYKAVDSIPGLSQDVKASTIDSLQQYESSFDQIFSQVQSMFQSFNGPDNSSVARLNFGDQAFQFIDGLRTDPAHFMASHFDFMSEPGAGGDAEFSRLSQDTLGPRMMANLLSASQRDGTEEGRPALRFPQPRFLDGVLENAMTMFTEIDPSDRPEIIEDADAAQIKFPNFKIGSVYATNDPPPRYWVGGSIATVSTMIISSAFFLPTTTAAIIFVGAWALVILGIIGIIIGLFLLFKRSLYLRKRRGF